MKKSFLSFSIVGLLVSIAVSATGQLASNTRSTEKFTVSRQINQENSSPPNVKVTPAVVRNFLKTYKDVSGETWFEVKDGFEAMFHSDDMAYQVTYDKKGNWLRTIKAYDEEKLSHDIRHIVKSTYYDYAINRVWQIEKPFDPVIYVVQLLGKTELISLRVCDNEMDEIQRFKRSK